MIDFGEEVEVGEEMDLVALEVAKDAFDVIGVMGRGEDEDLGVESWRETFFMPSSTAESHSEFTASRMDPLVSDGLLSNHPKKSQ